MEQADTPGTSPATGSGARRYNWHKIVAAAAMISLLCAGAYVDYRLGLDICFSVLFFAVMLKGLSEFYDMCESSRTGPFRRFGLVSAAILVVLHWIATPGTVEWFEAQLGLQGAVDLLTRQDLVMMGLVVAVLGSMWLQATKRDNDLTFESISSTLFGVLYLWFLPSFLVKLRHLGADGVLGGAEWNHAGTGLLVSTVAASKLADVGGYLFGTKIGRTKIIPRISPNKTYEGLAAGVALSVAVMFWLWKIGMLPFTRWWSVLIFGAVVSGTGVLGDLAESLLKRGSGRKDSGEVVPGFGGVLDVIDSILVSAPVAYFLAVILLRVGF